MTCLTGITAAVVRSSVAGSLAVLLLAALAVTAGCEESPPSSLASGTEATNTDDARPHPPPGMQGAVAAGRSYPEPPEPPGQCAPLFPEWGPPKPAESFRLYQHGEYSEPLEDGDDILLYQRPNGEYVAVFDFDGWNDSGFVCFRIVVAATVDGGPQVESDPVQLVNDFLEDRADYVDLQVELGTFDDPEGRTVDISFRIQGIGGTTWGFKRRFVIGGPA